MADRKGACGCFFTPFFLNKFWLGRHLGPPFRFRDYGRPRRIRGGYDGGYLGSGFLGPQFRCRNRRSTNRVRSGHNGSYLVVCPPQQQAFPLLLRRLFAHSPGSLRVGRGQKSGLSAPAASLAHPSRRGGTVPWWSNAQVQVQQRLSLSSVIELPYSSAPALS